MAQTAAHLVDHVIPPVPVRQWVISLPKRLRGVLGDRPKAVAAVTRIFLDEIETLLCLERLRCSTHATLQSTRPRLGAVSFLHRFGSGLNRHAHLHAAVTDGVFLPGTHGPDGPPAFLPARSLTQGDLAALTQRVRRRVIRWFRRQGFLDAHAAADMLAWEHCGFSIDASVRITLLDRDVPSYFQSLEHLLRYCARPPFALERLSVSRDAEGRIARIRYVLPRRWVILWAANWVGPGRKRKSTQPGASGVIELAPFAGRMPVRRSSQTLALAATALKRQGPGMALPPDVSWTGSPISSRNLENTGTGITECLRPITRCGRPSRLWRSATSASSGMPRPAGMPTLGTMIAAAPMQRLVPTTHPGLPGPS